MLIGLRGASALFNFTIGWYVVDLGAFLSLSQKSKELKALRLNVYSCNKQKEEKCNLTACRIINITTTSIIIMQWMPKRQVLTRNRMKFACRRIDGGEIKKKHPKGRNNGTMEWFLFLFFFSIKLKKLHDAPSVASLGNLRNSEIVIKYVLNGRIRRTPEKL